VFLFVPQGHFIKRKNYLIYKQLIVPDKKSNIKEKNFKIGKTTSHEEISKIKKREKILRHKYPNTTVCRN